MKKKYRFFAIKVVIIVLAIFGLSATVLTYNEALNIKDEYTKLCYDKSGFISAIRNKTNDTETNDTETNQAKSLDKIIKSVYQELGQAFVSDDQLGFYSQVKDNKANVLAYAQNYITLTKDNGDMRIILMEDAFTADGEKSYGDKHFTNDTIDKISFEGVCDDTFLYPDKMTWTDYSSKEYEYVFKDAEKKAASDTVSIKDWIGKDSYTVSINYMGTWYGDTDLKHKRNHEAKTICEEIYNNYIKGETRDNQTREGIFTTYVAGTGYLNENAVMPYVYVFHPIAMATEKLTGMYMILLCIAVIMILIICKMVKKMYTQQKEFELRTRKMTRGVAHELKTPLAITKTYVENWQYIEEEDREDYCRNMVEEIDHMNMLVNDLLELSRMECGAKKLDKEDVDLLALTNTISARMKGIIDERELELKINTDEKEQEYIVNADLEMMRIVISNFMSNAVKYADKRIDLHLSKSGKKVIFKIENDGPGISRQDIDRIWDTFYKTDDSRTNRIGSSGLGLAITKNILILHEAKYGYSSEPGNTSFWFELKKMEDK